MNYVRQIPTEECPLTKEKRSCSTSDCCGFGSIVCSFIALSIVITAALILQLVYGDNSFEGRLKFDGAVATDYKHCSQIGTKILLKGGNAVDAAVAATLCMSVVAPHKTGLGSGGYIMIYSHKTQEWPKIIDFLTNTIPDEIENIKTRIPALLRGLEYAHTLYGKLSWQIVVEPSAILAREGFEVSRDFAAESARNANLGIFQHINATLNLTLPNLASTLELVSKFGANVFYNGNITHKISLNKIANNKFLNEISKYKPEVILAQKSKLGQYAIFYPPTLNYVQPVIETIDKLNISNKNASLIESEIAVAEALIKLVHQLKNPHINYTETRRYTGVSSIDWQDTYVSVITGLSSPLDMAYETDAGFAFDKVDDKISLLSLAPIIFYDETAVCGLRGLFATDDSIVAGQILENLILRSWNVSVSVEYPRYYVLPDGIAVERDDSFPQIEFLRDGLVAIESTSKINADTIMKFVNVIIKKENLISSHSDSRGDGIASRFL